MGSYLVHLGRTETWGKAYSYSSGSWKERRLVYLLEKEVNMSQIVTFYHYSNSIEIRSMTMTSSNKVQYSFQHKNQQLSKVISNYHLTTAR